MASRTLVFLLCTRITILEAAKILVVIPVPSVSHQVVFRPLTQELVKRGHELVIVTTDPAFKKGETPENLTEIDVHDISYKLWKETVLSSETTNGTKDDLQTQIDTILTVTADIFELQVQSKEFQNLIKSKSHFDLLIVEGFIKLPLALYHIFKAPIIIMNSFGSIKDNLDIVGAPKRPVWIYPDCVHQKVYDLTLFDKMQLLYKLYKVNKCFAFREEEKNKIAKRLFGSDIPLLSELANNVDMLFLNVYPLWELNRPVPPSVIFIGGIHQNTLKELPKDLKSYLDSSKHGVIYLSFGTNVSPSQLPLQKIQAMVKALSKLPYDVIWKWDSDKLPGKSENIRIEKWVPQFDLLRHPKIKLFITQGGLQSTDEALIAGVPLIGVPLLGDQWFNVEHYVHHKLGLGLDMETLTEDTFFNAVRTVAEDDSYRKNVVHLRTLMHDQPQSALSRAVWWTEHVLRHGGGRHLRAPAANMSWAEYLDVQLLAVLVLGVLGILFLVAFSLYALLCFLMKISVIKFKVD